MMPPESDNEKTRRILVEALMAYRDGRRGELPEILQRYRDERLRQFEQRLDGICEMYPAFWHMPGPILIEVADLLQKLTFGGPRQ